MHHGKTFLAFYKFDLDLVFKVTIIESLQIETFESGTKCQLWFLKIFIMSVDTPIEELPRIHESGQFDFCHDRSSNRHFQ